MTESFPRLTVYGATGHTGTLVCRELARRERDFAAAGRNLERLQRLSSDLGDRFGVVPTLRQADVDDWSSLQAMFDRTNVLINCAGPFVDLGPPVARAAVRNDVHYLDTTGEQEYIRWMEEELAVEARKKHLVLMPACAYEYATGSLAAALALDQGAREIVVSYGVSNFKTSAGTKHSILRSIASDGVGYVDGELVDRVSAEEVYEVPTPSGSTHSGLWFAGGEPIFVPKMGDVDRAESCLRVSASVARLLSSMSGVLSTVTSLVQPLADRIIDATHREADRGETREKEAPFDVVAFDPSAGRWYTALSGFDPYPTTARIIVEAAERMDDRGEMEGGLQSPGAVFDPTEFAETVGIEVQLREN